jgi:hypothetical protein
MSRPWSPLVSYEDQEGRLCVDIFFRPDGTFGFELFRRDVEDGGGWYIVGHFARLRSFATRAEAEAAAVAAVPWLGQL